MTEHPTRAVIHLEALRHNLRIIREKIGASRRMLAVIKADAYGHGALGLAPYLQDLGLDMLGVAYVEEGLTLRQAGIKLPILVMAGALPDQIHSAIRSELILTISDPKAAKTLSRIACRMNRQVRVHIKVDTGMGRLGLEFDTARESISDIFLLPNLIIDGIFTHLATADESDPSYTHYQLTRFKDLIESLSEYGIRVPIIHMANSAAVIQHPNTYMDMVRIGIMLYGIAPNKELQNILPIRPIMTLKTKIIHIKRVEKGSSLSYGRSYICESDKKIAVIPIGYSDGFARCMSNKALVLIHGVKVPIVGTICMDMSIVDVTDIKGVMISDEVVLIGSQGDECITVHDWAHWQGTIPYEVLCAIGPKVTRHYHTDRDLQAVYPDTDLGCIK